MWRVLDEHRIATAAILKMARGGFEVDLLSSEDLGWLEGVGSFRIETHVPEGRRLFLPCLSEFGFKFAGYGEILLAWRE